MTKSQDTPTPCSQTWKVLNTPLYRQVKLSALNLCHDNSSFPSYMPKYIQDVWKKWRDIFFQSSTVYRVSVPMKFSVMTIKSESTSSCSKIRTNFICLSSTFAFEKIQPHTRSQVCDTWHTRLWPLPDTWGTFTVISFSNTLPSDLKTTTCIIVNRINEVPGTKRKRN